jgi:hypothetical protein
VSVGGLMGCTTNKKCRDLKGTSNSLMATLQIAGSPQFLRQSYSPEVKKCKKLHDHFLQLAVPFFKQGSPLVVLWKAHHLSQAADIAKREREQISQEARCRKAPISPVFDTPFMRPFSDMLNG